MTKEKLKDYVFIGFRPWSAFVNDANIIAIKELRKIDCKDNCCLNILKQRANKYNTLYDLDQLVFTIGSNVKISKFSNNNLNIEISDYIFNNIVKYLENYPNKYEFVILNKYKTPDIMYCVGELDGQGTGLQLFGFLNRDIYRKLLLK